MAFGPYFNAFSMFDHYDILKIYIKRPLKSSNKISVQSTIELKVMLVSVKLCIRKNKLKINSNVLE
jgi:hypothetical protein